MWAIILGSRPVSLWFGMNQQVETTDAYVEGSPFDRLVFLLLLGVGCAILATRRVPWRRLIRNNLWIFVFFVFLGISAAWSDYPFVSFKRWVKEVGSVVMILIVLTEDKPIEAFRALLARCTYVLVPLNVLLVKYYPDIGRYYNRWTYQPYFGGVTMDKNLLGMTLCVWGVSLCWIFLELRDEKAMTRGKTEMLGFFPLMPASFWLLFKSQSSTALACTILGCGILLAVRLPVVRTRLHRIGVYSFATVLLMVLLQMIFNLGELFTGILGRDLTLTGRTDIWQAVLNEPINPLLGTGYYSFWLGDRVERVSANFYYQLNEAHNGYLETYLNNGLIGLFLLVILLVSAARQTWKQLTLGSNYGALRLAFLVTSVIYGMTEAVFRFGLIWFVLLFVILDYPFVKMAAVANRRQPLRKSSREPQPGRPWIQGHAEGRGLSRVPAWSAGG